MGCGCGCSRSSVSSLTRRRMAGLTRSRYRSIGASAATSAADLAGQFNLQSYLPANIQDDAATASGYYQKFKAIADGATIGRDSRGFPNVQLSEAGTSAALAAMVAAIQVVPVLGQAFAIFLAIAPQAGAGAGVCSTDPPAGPLLSQLQSWKYFQPWTSSHSSYTPGLPGTFEAYANPLLEYNWLLSANCYASRAVASPVLLAQLVNAWNATHHGPPRILKRTGLNPGGFGADPSGYDPIAEALEQAWLGAHITPAQASGDFATYTNALNSVPTNGSMSIPVNTGPEIVTLPKVLTFHFGPGSGVGAKAPVAASSSSSSTAAAVAVVALGGAAAFFVSRSGGLAPALRRLRKLV